MMKGCLIMKHYKEAFHLMMRCVALIGVLLTVSCTYPNTAITPDNAVPVSTGTQTLTSISIYRASPQRTGEYSTRGVSLNPKLLWKTTFPDWVTSSPIVA